MGLTSIVLVFQEVCLDPGVLESPGDTVELLLLPQEVVTDNLRVPGGGERPGLHCHSVAFYSGSESEREG